MDDYWKKIEFAEIKEIQIDSDNENGLRVYCSSYPNGFTFQIRTFGAINPFGKGKKRNMIATIGLTIKDVEKLLKYMKKEKTEAEK